ncbi:unnamed protein product [Nesidiocoris tenuis]|uniref:Uncharacterized protein n=1 Tax=Nesidiocoris tenuis TaxID=355587 RepID=A0A6H5H0R1_9HEMI|nr:unnamed protein product [Nesidiocoris tenuis]
MIFARDFYKALRAELADSSTRTFPSAGSGSPPAEPLSAHGSREFPALGGFSEERGSPSCSERHGS